MLKSSMPHLMTDRIIQIHISKFTLRSHDEKYSRSKLAYESKYTFSPGLTLSNFAHKQIYLGVYLHSHDEFIYVSKICLEVNYTHVSKCVHVNGAYDNMTYKGILNMIGT